MRLYLLDNGIDLKIHESLTKYNIDYAAKKLQIVIENKERTDAIMAFVSIGLIAYNLSSNGSVPSSRANRNVWWDNTTNPWWDGNPMNLNLYQWPRP